MPTYRYSAISRDGARVSGVIDGYDQFAAVEQIRQSCDVVLKLTEVKERSEGLLNMEIGGNRLNQKALTVMCSQFAIILKAGIPISRAVYLVTDKTTDKPLKKVLKQVAEDVEAGRSLAASFEERGAKLLPLTFIETVRSGEEAGNVDRAFESLHRHYDRQTKMRGKVRGAMAYPLFVLCLAIGVVIVLMVKVVPTFMEMFAEYGSELPLMTRMLIGISEFFRKYILLMLAIAAVAGIAGKLYGNTETGRLRFAKLARRLPVLGEINQLNSASQFSATMATMLQAGLPMTRAVSITGRVIDNYYVSQEVGKLTARLEEGRTLASGIQEAGCLPAILTDMVGVGEDTGEMEATMSTMGDYYYAELEEATESALKKLEPALLIGLAIIAGFIVISIYMAMFTMYDMM